MESLQLAKHRAPEKKPVTFLSLPGELRNQICSELLPDSHGLGQHFVAGSCEEGRKASRASMLANKQIYKESVSLLYSQRTFGVSVDYSGGTHFLSTYVAFDNRKTTNFYVLNRIERLSPRINADYGPTVCDVQEALFEFIGRLRADRKLQSLDVRIDTMSNPMRLEDYHQGSETTVGTHDQRVMARRIHGSIEDGANRPIFRGHIAAFLMGPLRTIRNLEQFSIHFTNRAGQSQRKIRDDIRGLVRTNNSVPHYRIFCRYLEILRELLVVLAGLRNQHSNPAPIVLQSCIDFGERICDLLLQYSPSSV